MQGGEMFIETETGLYNTGSTSYTQLEPGISASLHGARDK
jgi:hypothetical protein